MSFENLLQFWTVHNRQIIEFVFVFTFFLILFVIYRQFFSKAGSASDHTGSPVSIDTSEIEEKLKKILENQSTFKAPSSEPGVVVSAGAGEAAASALQEIEKLKTELKEKEKALEEMKKSAPAAGVASGDVKKFEDKIKELEGRLQEYEIIAEDIADLSFYKEENARLQKEISGGGAKPAAPAPVAAAEPPPVAAAPVEPLKAVEAPNAEAAPAPAPGPEAAPVAAAGDQPTKKELDSIVDDDILKEFAAAVEGQKAAEAAPAAPTTPATPAASAAPGAPAAPDPQAVDPQKISESKELMGEFENFIKKG